MPDVGWYDDPEGDGQRWWDGTRWTDRRRPRKQIPWWLAPAIFIPAVLVLYVILFVLP